MSWLLDLLEGLDAYRQRAVVYLLAMLAGYVAARYYCPEAWLKCWLFLLAGLNLGRAEGEAWVEVHGE